MHSVQHQDELEVFGPVRFSQRKANAHPQSVITTVVLPQSPLMFQAQPSFRAILTFFSPRFWHLAESFYLTLFFILLSDGALE